MKLRPSIYGIVIALVVLLPGPRAAHGEVITQVIGYNTSGTSIDFPYPDYFDASLGTLDEVSISLNGAISTNYQALTPGEYSYTVYQKFFGPFGSFFEFEDLGASTLISGSHGACAATLGGCQPVILPFQDTVTYDMSFRFTRQLEELGINIGLVDSATSITPPVNILGSVSDFLEPSLPFPNEIDLTVTPVTRVSVTEFTSVTVQGLMTMTYDYTPFAATTPVAAPSTLLLLATGLTGIIVARGKRQTRKGTQPFSLKKRGQSRISYQVTEISRAA